MCVRVSLSLSVVCVCFFGFLPQSDIPCVFCSCHCHPLCMFRSVALILLNIILCFNMCVIHVLVPLYILSSVHQSIHTLLGSFIRSFIHSFVHSFIHSFQCVSVRVLHVFHKCSHMICVTRGIYNDLVKNAEHIISSWGRD